MELNTTVYATVSTCRAGQETWGSWPCVQAVTMTTSFALVLLFSIAQFVQVMVLRRRTVNRPLLILFFLIIQAILGLLYFAIVSHVIIYYLMLFDKLLLICILSYFLNITFLQLFHRDYLRSWVAWPWFVFCIFGITVILIIAMVHIPQGNNDYCYDISFGLLDAATFTLTLTTLFSVSCFTIRLNQQHKSSNYTPSTIGMHQALLLRRLVVLFCLTSIAEAAGDMTIRIMNYNINEQVCDGLLDAHSSMIGSIVTILKVANFILPAFAINYTFTVKLPSQNNDDEGESVRLAMAASYTDFSTGMPR